MIYDVAIIGAGVVGGFIARELSKYKLSICLLEKESDVGMVTSSANSGIIHAGYDNKPGSMKAKLNIRGNILINKAAEELRVPFQCCGSMVLAFNESEMHLLKELYQKGIRNGVNDISLINKRQALDLEPNISNEICGALYAASAGIICPYELSVGVVENAVKNGVDLKLESEVLSIKRLDGINKIDGINRINSNNRLESRNIFEIVTEKECIHTKYIVNAAGLYADRISAMVGDASFSIKPRKGEYILLDKNQGKLVSRVIFQTPSLLGKGILVTPSIDGNLLIGPNALDTYDREDYSTTSGGLEEVVKGARKAVPGIDLKQTVTSFAGLRAVPYAGDFIIERSKVVEGFINVAGIESPGLTSAPAIGEYVTQLLVEIIENESKEIPEKNDDFNPYRKEIFRLRDIIKNQQVKSENQFYIKPKKHEIESEYQQDDTIKHQLETENQQMESIKPEIESENQQVDTMKPEIETENQQVDSISQQLDFLKNNPAYGRVLCRCETVSEGEVVDCIHREAGARHMDAVKRRTRAGMGRCQGGFCTPRVAEVLSRELGIPMEQVTKMGGNSRLLSGKTK